MNTTIHINYHMKIILSFLYSFGISIAFSSAQDNKTTEQTYSISKNIETSINIRGQIVDKNTKNPIQYSTITLYSSFDSTIIGGSISNKAGLFIANINKQYFFIKVEFIGYFPKTITQINSAHKHDTIDLGIIELEESAELLGEVEIRAEKSTVMMSLDKRVFNVGKDLVNQGGTAEDILKNVPGVWVDINGNITLRSNGNVRILLNGQASLLINGKNSEGLRQIRASDIERIEIISNPSARYEAEGMAGIINIVLKENHDKGLNGAVSANIGNPDNFGIGGNLNYRKDKLNVFAGAGIWYVNRPGTGSFRNEFYNLQNPDSTLFSNMSRTHERKGSPINLKLGGDYYLNPKNTLTTSFYYRTNNDRNTSELIYTDAYGTPQNIHLITSRQEYETGKENDLNGFLRHRKTFSEKEHQLTTDIRYETAFEKETSLYDEIYFNGENIHLDTFDFHQRANNESGSKLLTFKSDYILPFGKEGKFEGGFQSTFRTITDDYKVATIIDNVEVTNTDFTNNFKYLETIHSLYTNIGNKVGLFSFQGGLRVEYSNIESGLEVNNQMTISKYTNLFPSAFISYDLGENNGMQISYSRRIERPTFLDLTPFFTLRDRRNIWRGNPYIRPEYTDAFELGYIKYWEGLTLSTVAYYRKTHDVIKRIQRLDENFPEVTITQAENLRIKENFGIEFTYSLSFSKWWRLNGDMNFYHSFSEGYYEHQGEQVYVGGQSFSLTSKTIAQFTFWNKLNAQLIFAYAAPRATTQGANKATAALNFATSMDVLKNNGTVTLSVSDLFNSNRRRSFSADDTFYSEDNFLWQSRALILSFHYRINQHKKQSQIYSSPVKENDEEIY